ncbi:hypothetical protein AB670_02777 [Chryseobacterium sp. MOF25P]|uniref:hypothetical protein n=1 Tax=unclassified Chryseobacterium TaxID=2593645 RepID=UPI000805FD56|nr:MULTISPECIES: hypothetical protein [unclassified Chryseobacterium]OBW40826.1 hypothetical protein AB670_02777 [Chryseobacterium sp. MOF25P]OBW45290.1 hypothetical protein AB671_02587 [Chryseobacterium sp. BGARF1]
MKIEINFTQSEIFEFLQKKGYEIKSWLWEFTDETFPNGIASHESWTFTACKTGENQSEENIFIKVFDKEIQQILKQIK